MDTTLADTVTLPWIASLAIGLATMLVTTGLLLAGLGLWPRRRESATDGDRRSRMAAAVDDPDQARQAAAVRSVAR